MTALSVNLNKIAVLRNSRGGAAPDLLRAAITCLDAGTHGLTVHPRPDARHIEKRRESSLDRIQRCHARRLCFPCAHHELAVARKNYPRYG